MQEAHNVDAAIVSDMQQRMGNNSQAPVQPAVEVSSPNPQVEQKESIDVPRGTIPATETATLTQPDAEKVESAPEQKAQDATPPATSEQPIDEYGNQIAKPRTYTEDEVQQMIRERMARTRPANQQPTQQQVQTAAENFKTDPNSEESWETQLESFVEKTIEKRQAKLSEQQWRQQEAQKQADFEGKFSSGMSKYSDFHQVVQPIVNQGMLPDGVMLAVRTLENPAAFVYGASKLYPKELERISRLNDGAAQALEVGRLHERMVKSSKAVTNAPRPLDIPRGDMPPKVSNMPSLEQRIAEHAKQKQARR